MEKVIKENKNLWDGEESIFYSSYINEELNDFRKVAWQEQILNHFEQEQVLNALDIGTGPGFIPIILSERGHHIIGIDSSKDMLTQAKNNAKKTSADIQLSYMDIEHIDFKENTFDLVTARNVTWLLDNPKQVYKNLYKVLKPKGKLLVYDANWHMQFYDEEILKKVREHEREYYEETGIELKVCSDEEDYYITKPLSNIKRPEWDYKVLQEIGFSNVEIKEDIGANVYQKWEQKLYQESPLFEICAVK